MNLKAGNNDIKKKSVLAVLKTNNALSTGQCINISKHFKDFEDEYEMIFYCVANYNLSYENFPEDYMNDITLLTRCILLNPKC